MKRLLFTLLLALPLPLQAQELWFTYGEIVDEFFINDPSRAAYFGDNDIGTNGSGIRLQGVCDSTLLDKTMLMYGSAMADSNLHNHIRCPLFLVGGGNGVLEG